MTSDQVLVTESMVHPNVSSLSFYSVVIGEQIAAEIVIPLDNKKFIIIL